ncbi:hypothetical protein KsCSTR_09140 [Candidatus Kuenenia stuttgartiensis]|uniref:Uncharacterized protein n=1 Tax=Kuenenia stuttgartiensis TaxID=174633 RepID=Q1PZ30_KUEST|nr:hypothetical protein KsCSTR_09140 [Candidatus Kuenenia stuttgartiensis]CAJ72342.1 unknown protein [Candidatus Kuenenia stuttgartiensis]
MQMLRLCPFFNADSFCTHSDRQLPFYKYHKVFLSDTALSGRIRHTAVRLYQVVFRIHFKPAERRDVTKMSSDHKFFICL